VPVVVVDCASVPISGNVVLVLPAVVEGAVNVIPSKIQQLVTKLVSYNYSDNQIKVNSSNILNAT